jgi:hypothetical protein
MSLVGELILGARELFGDPPVGVFPAPGTEMSVALGVVAACTIPAGNYFVRLTYRTTYGETLPGAESGPFAVDGTHGLRVSGNPPPGVTSVVAYFGKSTGSENQNQVLLVSSLPITIIAPGNPGVTPVRNTCYLPDSDGRVVGIFALYRWINDCLTLIAKLCGGGIPDMSGAGTVAGQPIYVLNGNWGKISNAWYDGYPLSLGRQTDIFRRNTNTGTTGTLTVNQSSSRCIVELYPQPARTSGQTTLAGNGGQISASANSALVALSNFTIGLGLVLVGTEIMGFASNNGGLLKGLVRGLGGTQPQIWPDGTPVTELNLMIYGLRVPSTFAVGMSTAIFDVPPGWETAVQRYLLSRFRDGEKNRREAESLMKEFTTLVNTLRTTKPIAGPVQIPLSAGRGTETYPGLGSPFGGVIVP